MRMRRIGFVAALALLLAACATLAPGADPVVVRTEQAMAVGQFGYSAAMQWCADHAAVFTPAQLAVVNKVREGFPHTYYALQSALDGYKAGKTHDISAALSDFSLVLGQVYALVVSMGGPNVQAQAEAWGTGQAAQKGGGA